MMKPIRILIVVTNVPKYHDRQLPTGLWLSELTHLYGEARQRGCDVVIASPLGGTSPIDPESLRPLVLDKRTKRYAGDPHFRALLAHTNSLADVAGQDFDCIYLTGGHGTMYDFPEDATLQAMIARHYENNKLVAAVCHGVCGLLNVRLSGGGFLVKDKVVTGYSWFEETLAGRKKAVPFNLEQHLRDRQARYEKAFVPLTSNVCEDGNLVTGQNPFSSKAIARRVIRKLFDGQ